MIKTFFEYVGSLILIGLFYLLVYYSHFHEEVKRLYYTVFGIPFRKGQDKFHPYYVRTDNK